MFEIKIIESGYFMADGGAMFGSIPKRAWQRRYPASESNLCPMAMRCLLAVSDEKKILVDLGIGNKHLQQLSYYQPYMLVDIADALKVYDYKPSDITDVVLTHIHFDHCGYATYYNNEKLMPSFPNARYWISTKQWETYLQPNRLERNSIFADNIQPIADCGLLSLIDKDMPLSDGFDIRIFDGHTVGQLVAYIKTAEGIVTFPGDLIPTSTHVSLEWISANDICALTSLTEKERFLSDAVQNAYTLIYYHDARVVKSKVKQFNNNYKAEDCIRL